MRDVLRDLAAEVEGDEATRTVHENARGCTISAGVGGAEETAPATDANGRDKPVHENARRCTVSAGAGSNGTDAGSDAGADVGLTEQQRTALALLLLGRPYGAVARAIGVDPSTLYRWRHDDAFRAALEHRRNELWQEAAERMRALVHPALDVLEEEVHDEYDRSRMRAVGMILRFSDLRKCVPPGKRED